MTSRIRNALLALALALGSHATLSQEYPNSTIRLLVPVAPGGPLDNTARLLGEQFSANYGQPVLVENRPGAATLLAARAVAQAKPDGYTLLLTTSSVSSYSAFIKNPGVDLVKDFTFISLVTRLPQFVAVSTESKINTLQELVAAAKSRPGQLNYAVYGNAIRVMNELLNKSLAVKAEPVSYAGAAPAVQALLRGDITYMLESMSTLKPLAASGRVKILAVTEGTRVNTFADIPTVSELGFAGSDFGIWYGLIGPAGMPSAITDSLAKEVSTFVRSSKAKGILEPLGFALTSSTPQQLRQIALRDEQTLLTTSKALGIQPE
jgi:tripartite-type tricarboxylate transporter receptor subunit TctC